jgi:pimeloyl-ACP methyl ester carboxylesterase
VATYVLVHGSWHGAWTWDKVLPLLEQAGHRAVAFDLPAHGDDRTPAATVTLESYVERVCEIVTAQAEPVVLVGHSMAGIVITQVGERCPDAIDTLVYLCAFIPRDGQALRDLDQSGEDSLVPGNVVVDQASGCSTVRSNVIRDAFYGDCSQADYDFAMAGWREEPLAPLATPVAISAEKFGRIRRVYIECLQDRAVSLAVQRRMYEETPCHVMSLDTGHSPFFSAPGELVHRLTSV